jgi:hypothetical protein
MSNIDGLAADWLSAKAEEQVANMKRLAIEKELTAALEAKDEGSVTHTLEAHKVTLTQPVTRKVDTIKWEEVKGKIPEAMWPVKVTVSADAAGMKWLAENEPKLWADIAMAFETKAGKLGVKVEALKNGHA